VTLLLLSVMNVLARVEVACRAFLLVAVLLLDSLVLLKGVS